MSSLERISSYAVSTPSTRTDLSEVTSRSGDGSSNKKKERNNGYKSLEEDKHGMLHSGHNGSQSASENYTISSDYSSANELAAPSPFENPREQHIYRHFALTKIGVQNKHISAMKKLERFTIAVITET